MFNAVKFINTGFEYSLRGNESEGFVVVTCLSSRKRHYRTLNEAHEGIMRSFKVFMAK